MILFQSAPAPGSERYHPTRNPLTFQRKKGQIVLDQIRTVDKTRLVKRFGRLDNPPLRAR